MREVDNQGKREIVIAVGFSKGKAQESQIEVSTSIIDLLKFK